MLPATGDDRSEGMTDVIQQHIEVVHGEGGPKAVVRGHRVRVQDIVVWHEKLGLSADDIVHQYPSITLADVYAALAYYWDHRDEIEAEIARSLATEEEFRRLYPGRLAEKLARLRTG